MPPEEPATDETPAAEEPNQDTITVADVTEEAAPAEEKPAEEAPKEGEELAADDESHDAEETALRDDKGRFKKGGVQARIDELTRGKREAERRASYYEGLATRSTAQDPAEDAARPTADQFDDYGDYVEALTDWKVDQKTKSLASDAAKGVMQHEREANYAERLAEAKTIIPDFMEVVEKSDIGIAPHVGEAVFDSTRGPEIFYHLAQHPEVAERLNGLTPVRAALEIGKLEAQLEAPATKRPSNAPAPISPISTGQTSKVNLANADMDTYVAERRKQGANFR